VRTQGRLLVILLSVVVSAGPAFAQGQTDAQTLRAEIERIRREAADERRKQEERIQALEKKLEELLKEKEKPATAAPAPVTSRSPFKARVYGFARADVDINSRKMFSHPHLPFWALSPDDPRARNRGDGDFTIHPRLTRLGLDTEAPPVSMLGNAKLTGKLEIDFFNFAPGTAAATSNSRHFIRSRHLWGRLDWPHAYLLFGQTWDLVSPLFPTANDDVLMWYAGNLGDRRPQIRAGWEPVVGKGKAGFHAAILSAGAIDGTNRDGDLSLDGEESDRPLIQGRAAITQPSWVKGQMWELGIWGHNGEYRFDRAAAINGRRAFSSNALGLDLRMPITSKLVLQGEAWTGKALNDIRGGVGQDINAITGEDIHSVGGWAELLYTVNTWYTLGGGFTIDNPDNDEVTPFTGANQTATGRTHNRTYYIVNRFNLGSGFQVGADWMFFDTEFRGLRPGSTNRWNLWLRHNF